PLRSAASPGSDRRGEKKYEPGAPPRGRRPGAEECVNSFWRGGPPRVPRTPPVWAPRVPRTPPGAAHAPGRTARDPPRAAGTWFALAPLARPTAPGGRHARLDPRPPEKGLRPPGRRPRAG